MRSNWILTEKEANGFSKMLLTRPVLRLRQANLKSRDRKETVPLGRSAQRGKVGTYKVLKERQSQLSDCCGVTSVNMVADELLVTTKAVDAEVAPAGVVAGWSSPRTGISDVIKTSESTGLHRVDVGLKHELNTARLETGSIVEALKLRIAVPLEL